MAGWAVFCREIREDGPWWKVEFEATSETAAFKDGIDICLWIEEEKGVSLDFESFEVQPVAGMDR